MTGIGKTILKWGALAGALTAISIAIGQAWGIADDYDVRPVLEYDLIALQKVVEQQAQSSLLQRFYFLLEKTKWGSLTFEETQELCRIARELQFTGVPGCQSG